MNLPVQVRLILLHAVDEAGNILHTLASMVSDRTISPNMVHPAVSLMASPLRLTT
jgi:hypothetical protein